MTPLDATPCRSYGGGMRDTERVTLRLPPDLVRRIDVARDLATRNAYVARLLDAALTALEEGAIRLPSATGKPWLPEHEVGT